VALKLGYVGIKNRSQQDIKDKVRVSKALQHEEEYFAKHAVYSSLP
jgi:replication fork clamp-binding protein CrfC